MKWHELLGVVREEPLFDSSLLLAGRDVKLTQVRLQLARWTSMGRLLQLRRGVYLLAPPYRKVEPHPFLVANALRRGSYVSLQSALQFYGLVPEHVPVVTSVCTGRPAMLDTPFGRFAYQHVGRSYFTGYHQVEVAAAQHAFMATPEKALLDLVHLTPGGSSPRYLNELRIDTAGVIRPEVLIDLARNLKKPKLIRATERLLALRSETAGELP